MEQLKNESSSQYEYMEERKMGSEKVWRIGKEAHMPCNHIWLPDE